MQKINNFKIFKFKINKHINCKIIMKIFNKIKIKCKITLIKIINSNIQIINNKVKKTINQYK